MHRGAEAAHTFVSPLAQIFQPLVVDDDIIPEEEPLNSNNSNMTTHGMSSSPPPAGVSYGPASRRRLSSMQSMHRRNPTTDYSSLSANVSPTHANANAQSHSHPMLGRFLDRDRDQKRSREEFPAFSSSPESQQHRPEASRESLTVPTAGEVTTGEEDEGEMGGIEWRRKMERMEERQERIEGLLERIARDLGGSRRS